MSGRGTSGAGGAGERPERSGWRMAMPMHFHFVALHYFKETVKRGSIRQAAEALNVAASAVNRQILKLEDQLDCQLFERMAGGVRLTGAGEVFYHYVLRHENDLERTVSEIEDMKGIRRGHVSIVCEEGIAKDFLPRLLVPFQQDFPRVTFRISVTGMASVLDAVADGSADIGVAFDPTYNPSLRQVAKVPVALGAAMPPGHRLSTCRSIRLSDLDGEAVILPDEKFVIHERLDQQRQATGLALSMTTETDSFETMTSLVKAGAGLGIRTRIGILDEIARGEIVFVPFADRDFLAEQVAICTKAQRTLPVAAAQFCERMVAQLSELTEKVSASRLEEVPEALTQPA